MLNIATWPGVAPPPFDPPEEPRKPRGSHPDASGWAARATKLPEQLRDLEPPADPAACIASWAQVDRLRIKREPWNCTLTQAA